MKKILSIALLFALAIGATAQSTSPRFGTTPGKDNTFRTLSNAYLTPTDAASATIDTFAVYPKNFRTIIRLALVDSVCAGNPTVTRSYAGDEITFVISAASGTPFLRFVGSNWITAGTATMTTRLRSVIKFIFDGAKWVETGRYTQ